MMGVEIAILMHDHFSPLPVLSTYQFVGSHVATCGPRGLEKVKWHRQQSYAQIDLHARVCAVLIVCPADPCAAEPRESEPPALASVPELSTVKEPRSMSLRFKTLHEAPVHSKIMQFRIKFVLIHEETTVLGECLNEWFASDSAHKASG